MRNKAQLSLAVLLTLAAVNSNAQVGTAVITRAGSTGNVFGQSGPISLTTYDRNQLEVLLVKNFQDRQSEDRKYVEGVLKEIETSMNLLLDDAFKAGGLRELSDLSLTAKSVDLIDYMARTREFEKLIVSITTKINGILLLPSTVRPGQALNIEKQERTELPAQLKVDLDKVVTHYKTQLDKITGPISQLAFLINMPGGIPKTVKGIGFRPEGPVFNPDVLIKMREDMARDLEIERAKVQDDVDQYNLYSRKIMFASIKAFGTTQKYRLQLNKAGRDANVQALEELFWTRFYMRATYGEKIGTFGVDYKKQQLNWDFFSSKNKINWSAEFLRKDEDLIGMQDSMTAALVSMTSRTPDSIRREAGLLANLMNVINTARTFVAGEIPLAEINALILKLMVSDIEQELMLSKGGGLKALRAAYRSRYYTSPTEEANVKLRAKQYLSGSSESEDIEQDNKNYSSTNLRGAFSAAALKLDNVIDRLEQAEQRLKAIDELRASSGAGKRVDKRREI